MVDTEKSEKKTKVVAMPCCYNFMCC